LTRNSFAFLPLSCFKVQIAAIFAGKGFTPVARASRPVTNSGFAPRRIISRWAYVRIVLLGDAISFTSSSSAIFFRSGNGLIFQSLGVRRATKPTSGVLKLKPPSFQLLM